MTETERREDVGATFDLADCLLDVISLAQDRPEAAAVILAVGSQLALGREAVERRGGLFEDWLIERWLQEIRSDDFLKSAQYQYLAAEYEREMMGGSTSRAGDARKGQLRSVGHPSRSSGNIAR